MSLNFLPMCKKISINGFKLKIFHFGLFLLFSLLLLSCGDRDSGKKGLTRRWVDGVKEMKERYSKIDEVVNYFSFKWQAISFDVMADHTLAVYQGNAKKEKPWPFGKSSRPYGVQEDKARTIFVDQFGLEPPFYFPPAVESYGKLVPWADAVNRVEWEKLFKRMAIEDLGDAMEYLENWRQGKKELAMKEVRAKKAAQKYGIVIWEARSLIEIVDELEVFKSETDRAGNKGQFVAMRRFTLPGWLDLMEQLALVKYRLHDSVIEWQLTELGQSSLGKKNVDDFALEILRSGRRPRGNLAGPLVEGRYHGVTRVLRTGWETDRDYDPSNKNGYNTGQWIDVEVIEGIVYFNKPRYPGDVVRGIFSYGGDTGIVGKPKRGDLVGYREVLPCLLWEKIEDK